jgi:peptidoglycan/xylan/chitin deacetylase (PgdA/CDA1 family)
MILLNFDLEEFDMPSEYGSPIPFDEQIAISTAGTTVILDLLKKHDIKCTFFCTAVFALNNTPLMERIIAEGHEVASHTYDHSKFEIGDLLRSKETLTEITGKPVLGFRMPRMMPVSDRELYNAGYLYNSSINPTWIPGRYNNLHRPRNLFCNEKVLQLPASVGSDFRFPLFWLSFHNLPLWYYKHLCKKAYQKDGYLNLYYHPWEFTPLHDKKKFGFYNIVGCIAWTTSMLAGGHYLQKLFLDSFNYDLKEHLEIIVLGIVLVTTAPVLYKLLTGKKKDPAEPLNSSE